MPGFFPVIFPPFRPPPLSHITPPERGAPRAGERGARPWPVLGVMGLAFLARRPLPTIHPEEVVARGAAVRAGMAERGQGLDEMVMTDVAPFTLGIETSVQRGEGAS